MDQTRIRGPPESWHFLTIEDVGEATQALQARGIPHTRMSHFEVLTHLGQHCFDLLHQRHYTHLWISVPRKHHERGHEHKHHSHQSKAASHHARLLSYIQTAIQQKIPIFIFGTPGTRGHHMNQSLEHSLFMGNISDAVA